MKALLALLAIALIGLCADACGGSSKTSSNPPNRGYSLSGYPISDRDNDGDHNDDDGHVLDFGHLASPSDRQASVALVKSYFAAAAAEDGAKACSLLVPAIAESVVEDYGHTEGLTGTTCAMVLSKLFKQHHRLLAVKSSNLEIMRVGIEGTRALVAMNFSKIPEARQITERRVGSTWRIVDLLDGIFE
jgi:hypothetical protein